MKNFIFFFFGFILVGLGFNSCTQGTDILGSSQLDSDGISIDMSDILAKGKPQGPGGGGGSSPLLLPLLPGANEGSAIGINNNGEIVGYAAINGYRHPTYWSSSSASPTDLGLPDGISYAKATSISDAGYIVGSTGDFHSNSTAIEFTLGGAPVAMEHLVGAGLAYAWEVNNLGFVSGTVHSVSFKNKYAWGVSWENGIISDVGNAQESTWTEVFGNNDDGTLVGYSLAADGRNIPFTWNNGSFTTLPYLGQGFGQQKAHDINNNGLVSGACRDDAGTIHPVMWDNGQLIDYGIFPGNINGGWAEIVAVNDLGVGVGWGWGTDGRQHALLFKDGNITQLSEPADAFITLAHDINDAGQIVGETYYYDGSAYVKRAAVWTDGGSSGGGGKPKGGKK